MRKRFVAVVAALLMGAVMAPTAAGANNHRRDVCHRDDLGIYQLLSVAEKAIPAHLNHGDGMIGDAVPGMNGFVFDDDCVPMGNHLVRAISTDNIGNVRVIAELLDTNGDGVPSTGDTAKFYEYPKDFTGTDYGSFDTTECVLDDFVRYNLDNSRGYDIVRGGGVLGCEVLWIQQGQYQGTPEYLDNFFMINRLGSERVAAREILFPAAVDQLSVSRSTDNINLSSASPDDDAFVDIEFNFTP